VHVATSKDSKVDWEKIEDDESFNKRIGIKILKNRAQPKPKFQPLNFKNAAMKDLQVSQSVKEFRESNFKSFNQSQGSLHVTLQNKQKSTVKSDAPTKRTLPAPSRQQEINAEEKKQRVDEKLGQLHSMKIAEDFIPDYFGTEEGQQFTAENPPKPLSQEAIIRMQQRLERQHRSQYNAANPDQAADDQNQQQTDENEGRDNPIVALEPDELKQGSHFTGSKKERSMIANDKSKLTSVEIAALPSLYMQEKVYIFDKEQEGLLKAEEHHIVKTKDFDVYGRLREDKPFVKSLAKATT